MKSKISFTILVLFLIYSFFGCNTGINNGIDDHTTVNEGTNEHTASNGAADAYTAIKVVPVIPKGLQKPEEFNQTAVSVAKGANDFAFRLSAKLAAKGTTENMVCSPLSVWIPLTALVNAVDVQRKADLLTALRAAGINDGDINTAVSRMLYDLTKQRNKEYKEMGWLEDYHDPVKIANAIFVDHTVTIKDDFTRTFMDYYRGSSINVDFKSPLAVTEVNDWVNKNTGGMIRNIIEEFNPVTAAVLAGAIYFSDRWNWEFDPDKTKTDIFYAPGGETEASYMLREGDNQSYFEDERLQATSLSFTTGGGLAILLPKDGDAAGLLASLTNDYFLAIQNGSTLAQGRLLLPRFSIEGDVMRLNDILIDMGIPLFDSGSLTRLIKETTDVQLSDAMHKAVIDVDEKGTTAAAVTILLIDVTAPWDEQPPKKPFEMNCDKPFVFILYDYTQDGGTQVLFTGMVNQP